MISKDVPKYLEKMSDIDHINQLNKEKLERLDYAVDPNHPINHSFSLITVAQLQYKLKGKLVMELWLTWRVSLLIL